LRCGPWRLPATGLPVGIPFRSCRHSWPCAHPRGPRSLSWSRLPDRLRRTARSSRPSFPGVHRPSDAPSVQNPLPDAPVHSGRSRRFRARLVAGFHTRFGPPSPFPTTLTVCSPAHPVACFSHSRPWGWASRLPAPCPFTSIRGPTLPDAGGRSMQSRGSRSKPPASRLAPHALVLRCSGRKRPFQLRLPAPYASASVRRRPILRPKAVSRPSLGSFADRVAPFDHRGSHHDASAPTPAHGVSSPVRLDPRPRVTASLGRPTGNEPDRFRPGPPCAPGPARSRPPDRSRLPTYPDRFPDSTRRLRGRFIGCSAGPSATRTRY
jgi:hypothetical protein